MTGFCKQLQSIFVLAGRLSGRQGGRKGAPPSLLIHRLKATAWQKLLPLEVCQSSQLQGRGAHVVGLCYLEANNFKVVNRVLTAPRSAQAHYNGIQWEK